MNIQELINILNVIRKEGLNLSSVLTFLVIRQTGETIYQRDIKVDFSPAKLSINVNKLIEKGYLQEIADKTDNRRKILFITENGNKFLNILLKGE